MFMMNMKLQNFFLRRFNRDFCKVTINNACFNISSSTSSYVYSDYSKSRTNIAQNFLGNQRSSLLNNVINKQYSSRVQNNFQEYKITNVSYPRIVSHVILYNGRRHTGYNNQYCNNVRHLSSTSIDSIAEPKIPHVQFSGYFKTLSESMPIKIVQDSLLSIHDYTGLPWWSVIVLTTIMIRTTVTLPLSFYQQYIWAKIINLKYEMNELVKEMKMETRYGIQKYNWSQKYARHVYNKSVNKQWNKLIVRDNCHPAKTSILVLVQIPLWISLSISIRNLCYMLPKQDASAYATYQEFATGGFLWITNLTVPDPFILPIAMGLFNLAIIEINYMNTKGELTKFKKYITNFFRIIAIGMIPIAMCVPSCISLYWAISSAFGLFQNLVLLSPKLCRFVKMPVTESHPYLLLRDKIMARFRFKGKAEIPPKM